MARVDKINSLLEQEIAEFISQNTSLDNYLITIKKVDCSPDLKNAIVYLSVLPEKFFGTALSTVRKINTPLSNHLNRKLNLRKVPKLKWQIDASEKEYAKIEKILREIEEED